MTRPAAPTSIDEAIAAAPEAVRPILHEIRRVIRAAAPDAQEVISYGMPAFKQGRILIYFAAFKGHIGLFPPIAGDPELEAALAPYYGLKRNLKFPLDRPIPYDLIERIVRLRVRQEAEHLGTKKSKKTDAAARAARA